MLNIVFGLIAVATVASASPRGVMVQHAALFEDIKQFTCLDGSATIPFSRVNDEYCDCQDGSDEPGTAACTYVLRANETWAFQCARSGSDTPHLVRHSRVNDGKCDCCDGSDEYDGETQCADTCAELALREEEERKARAAVRAEGLKKKAEMVVAARLKAGDHTRELEEAQIKLASAKKALEDHTAAKAEHEAVEAEEREAVKKKSEEERAEWEKSRPPQPEPTGHTCLRWVQTQECRGDGPADGDITKNCAESIPSSASGYCLCDADGEEKTHPRDCGHESLTCDNVCQYGDFVAESGPVIKDGTQHVNEKAQAARNDYHAAEREHNDLDTKVRNLQEKVDRLQDDSQLAFHAMDGECYELDKGHYLYKLCPFHRMEQVQGGRGTNMGNWKSFGEQTYSSWGAKHDFSKMIFNDGERCWSGPARETTVSLVCGPSTVLLNVDEPSMCVYSAVLQTPAICE